MPIMNLSEFLAAVGGQAEKRAALAGLETLTVEEHNIECLTGGDPEKLKAVAQLSSTAFHRGVEVTLNALLDVFRGCGAIVGENENN